MIELTNMTKTLNSRTIFSNFSLKVHSQEFITIVGESGCGKTTLLNIMGLLDSFDKGKISVLNRLNPTGKELQYLRRYHLGFLFQNYVLMNNKTVKENLKLSTKFRESKTTERDYTNVLEKVQLDETLLEKKIFQLSGGEQQRVAMARVLLKPCSVIFADEPTGNLDTYNRDLIVSLFRQIQRDGKTIICVTHDMDIAKQSDRIIKLS